MSLEKQSVVDQIDVTESGVVQVRTATRILEDGNVISSSLHRHVIVPGHDYSGEDNRVKAVCAGVHDQWTIDAYQAAQAAQLTQGV